MSMTNPFPMNTASAESMSMPNIERRKKPIRGSIQTSLELYFTSLKGQKPNNLYQMVLAEVEIPLLQSVMLYTRGNQSKAAQVLGINRNTLRKKLKGYGLD